MFSKVGITSARKKKQTVVPKTLWNAKAKRKRRSDAISDATKLQVRAFYIR